MSQRGITDWRCGICIGGHGDVQIWGIRVQVGCKLKKSGIKEKDERYMYINVVIILLLHQF